MHNAIPVLPSSLCVSREGPVLKVTLARPAKRNALNDEMIAGLGSVFASVPGDVGCIVLSGAGDHFCAGLDLSELSERDAVAGVMHSRSWHTVMDAIQFGRAPVVAALHGAVVGGGLELASACHIRVAETGAFFALPEGQRGIFVGGGASVRVPRLIGQARVMDMMLTGRTYAAEEGVAIGLAQYLEPAGAGLARAMSLAAKIAGNASMTNFAITHVLPRISDVGQDQGLMMEAMAAAIAQSAPEAKQRVRDFLEKRAGKVGQA